LQAAAVEIFAHVLHDDVIAYPGVGWVCIGGGLVGTGVYVAIHIALHCITDRMARMASLEQVASFERPDASTQSVSSATRLQAAARRMVAQRLQYRKVNELCRAQTPSRPLTPSPGEAASDVAPKGGVGGWRANDSDDAAAAIDYLQERRSNAGLPALELSPTRKLMTSGLTSGSSDSLPTAARQTTPTLKKGAAGTNEAGSNGSASGLTSGLTSGSLLPAVPPPEDGEGNGHGHVGHGGAHQTSEKDAALVIWAACVIDAIPESIVIGMMYVSSKVDDEVEDDASVVAFMTALVLSALPEAMATSDTLRRNGFGAPRILGMWLIVVAVTSLGACAGSLAFDPAAGSSWSSHAMEAFVEGVCGGMIAAMVFNTILPEAHSMLGGGSSTVGTGISAMLGFLVTLGVSVASSAV